MVLNKDGTGTFERRFSNKITDAYYGDIVKDFKFDVDDLHSTYNIKWTVVDGYVVIQFSGYNYYPQSSNYETIYVSDGEPDEFSKTYELRANKMFDIDQIGDTAQFTKID